VLQVPRHDAMGKSVPTKYIIGNVTMFPIPFSISGFFVTVPTTVPNESKSVGFNRRKERAKKLT